MGHLAGTPYRLARYSYVAPAGDVAVLKVTPVEDDEADEEADALALWAGDGAVRLLRHDPARRALLLARAHPGDDLASLPEPEATQIAVDVAQRLWRPADAPFRWVGDHVPRWLAAAEEASGRRLAPLARSSTPTSTSNRGRSCTGTFTTTMCWLRGTPTSRSIPSRCSESPSSMSPRSCGTRCPIGCAPTSPSPDRRFRRRGARRASNPHVGDHPVAHTSRPRRRWRSCAGSSDAWNGVVRSRAARRETKAAGRPDGRSEAAGYP
jgi:hypothetical protein